jgi:hypothetical protein
MATNTPNYNLVKPDLVDIVDIADINGNMDILDTTIKAVADSIPTGGGGIDTSFLLMGA